MSEISVGDRVKFRVGRRYSVGRVANRDGTMATIVTISGKMINRKLRQLERVPCVIVEGPKEQAVEQAAEAALPTCRAETV